MWVYNYTESMYHSDTKKLDTNITNELTHYGVLGMKWGVRKARYNEARYAKRSEKVHSQRKKERLLQKSEKYKNEAESLERKIEVSKSYEKKLKTGEALTPEEQIIDLERKHRIEKGKEKCKKIIKGAIIAGGVITAADAFIYTKLSGGNIFEWMHSKFTYKLLNLLDRYG